MAYAEAVASTGGLIGSPAPEAIREQLGRIQGSSDFDVPERAHKFLGYVIEETLSGRADRIKAYSIALEVFGRDSSFDAQADPVVRIEAGRVRRALERYYLTAGQRDQIVITIPKGAYVPVFERRELEPAPASTPAVAAPLPLTVPRWSLPPRWMSFGAVAVAGLVVVAMPVAWNFPDRNTALDDLASGVSQPDIPRLLIEPFEDLTRTEASAIIARGLTEEIIGQIAPFKDIVIIDHRPIENVPLAYSPRYILGGSVRTEGDAIRLTARLRSASDNSILWAQSFDANRQVQELLSMEAAIAREVTTALAQPNGIIFQADAAQVAQTPPDDWQAYTCVLAYYTYRLDFDPKTYAFVRSCLERTVKQFPAYSTAWALLSITYFDGWRFQYNVKPTSVPPLDQAVAYARRAVDIDPQNVRGQQALMMALGLNGEVQAALEVGRRALDLNPNDIELRGEYGVRLALSGKWEDGKDLVFDTLQRSAGPESYYETVLGLIAYMMGDNETAAKWIRKANVQANPLFHLIAAMTFGRLGAEDEAARERDWLLANAHPMIQNIHKEVAIRIARLEDQAYIIDGLALAGLPIPPKPD